jgi:hypothetical protein
VGRYIDCGDQPPIYCCEERGRTPSVLSLLLVLSARDSLRRFSGECYHGHWAHDLEEALAQESIATVVALGRHFSWTKYHMVHQTSTCRLLHRRYLSNDIMPLVFFGLGCPCSDSKNDAYELACCAICLQDDSASVFHNKSKHREYIATLCTVVRTKCLV